MEVTTIRETGKEAMSPAKEASKAYFKEVLKNR